MAIAHESVKCRRNPMRCGNYRPTNIILRINPHIIGEVFFLERGIRMNGTKDNKKLLFTIDKAYVTKYNLDSSYLGKRIVIYEDRYSHIEKHKFEFSSQSSYEYVINNVDVIVKNPDFIVIDEKKKGIEFIKTLDDNVLVVARITISTEMKIKSLYPINESKKQKLERQRTNN